MALYMTMKHTATEVYTGEPQSSSGLNNANTHSISASQGTGCRGGSDNLRGGSVSIGISYAGGDTHSLAMAA